MQTIIKPLKEQKFDHLLKKHPCFSSEAHFKHGRIHLPVSANCNIHCKFCERGLNKCARRPGVSSGLLSPEQALQTLEKALLLCPEITVVGIAGPGDTLATEHALESFERIHMKYPDLIKCLSTNGLLLEKYAARIADAGVKTISVTINAVQPDILQHICDLVMYEGKPLRGQEAAIRLIGNQLAGIRKAAEMGVAVKINTVLIPGLNDQHIEEIARVTADLGAALINIIPLIPQAEMSWREAPDCSELNLAREAAEKHLTVFRHCRQCRADACGIPGLDQEFFPQLYGEQFNTFSHG